MTSATEQFVEAYAFCHNGRCTGYLQEPVQGVRTTTSWTYMDSGGDLPGIEKTTEMVRFADEADGVCPTCEGPRDISEQLRPEYPNISNQDPMGIFEFRGKTEKELLTLRHAQEIGDLKRDQELTAALARKADRSGRKPAED